MPFEELDGARERSFFLRSFQGVEKREGEEGLGDSAFFSLLDFKPSSTRAFKMSLGPHYVLLGLTSITVTQVESESVVLSSLLSIFSRR